MSIYRCEKCDCTCDADYDGCNPHPNETFGNVCDKCDELISEEDK